MRIYRVLKVTLTHVFYSLTVNETGEPETVSLQATYAEWRSKFRLNCPNPKAGDTFQIP